MDSLATVLVRRTGQVFLPSPTRTPGADTATWMAAFEADLAARGWVLDASAWTRFGSLDTSSQLQWAVSTTRSRRRPAPVH